MKKEIVLLLIISYSAICHGQTASGYLSLGEDSIYYETAGSGRNIILIHDGLLPGVAWDEQFVFFSRDYHVTRYDRRGYGFSSPATGSYTHMEDLMHLYEHLNIESAILIASSSGGALAIDFTLEYPEKVDALVLVGAVVGGFSYSGHMRTRGGHLPESFGNAQEENIYYASNDPYYISSKNTDTKKTAVEMLTAYPQRILRRPQFVRPDIPPARRLNEIDIPTLILIGEYDIPDVHAVSGVLSMGITNSKRHVIQDAGHVIPLEQPAQFNKTVAEFIKANLSSPGSL